MIVAWWRNAIFLGFQKQIADHFILVVSHKRPLSMTSDKVMNMRKYLFLVFFFVLPSTFASTAVGVVSQIRASESTDLVIFSVEGEISDAPRCNENRAYTFRLDAPGGQAILELLKLSFLEKLPVRVVGLNTCSRGYESEGVQEVSIG